MNLDHGYPRQNGGTDNLFSFESAFKFFVLQQELPLCGAPFPSQVNRSSELGSVFHIHILKNLTLTCNSR